MRRRADSFRLALEIETYRHCAHVGPESDDMLKYRPAEELERWKGRDPVLALRRRLAAADEANLARHEAEVESEISIALAAAKRAPFPDFSAMMSSNWSGEYAPAARRFISRTAADFESGQSEARLGPF